MISGICLFAAPVASLAAPIPPAPVQWVTDTAGFLSKATAQKVNERLAAYQQSSGHQVFVWIGKTTGGDPLDDWAVRVFKAWRVGRKGYDDGLVLFVMADDRAARIEVGYGLEGQIPDALASRIVNDVLIPRIKTGDRDGAISAAVDQVVSSLGGESARPAGQKPITLNLFQSILLALAILAVLILAIRYPVFGYYLLMVVTSMMRRGGGGGSDAGGGGGRSGGGGAGGKW